jgi:arylsulfatase A-like enzyme
MVLSRLAALVFLLLMSSCYPISVSRGKWKIKKDKDMALGKETYLSKTENPKSDAPNVIMIVCDDLGKYEVSAYGVDHISTPNIDRIGNEGVVFEQGYVTAPTCSPSRAGMMTGRTQNRYGFETQVMEFYPTNMVEYLSGRYMVNTGDFVLNTKPEYPSEWQVEKQGVPPTEIVLSEAMKKYGYATGMTGKWHLGASKHQIPTARGFDYQYGFLGAFSLYTKEHETNGVIHYNHTSFSGKYQWNSGRYGQGAIQEQGMDIEEDQYLTFAIRDKAMHYIEENKDNPFFLYCTFSAPHVPFQVPVDYYCMYSHVEDEQKRIYYGMISALDDAIGSILDRLDSLGIAENTIIYLISDNGGAAYTGATDNGPLKGGKLTQFEGGINVPFMMKWPAKIPAGLRYEKPVISTDIFATTIANIGGTLPSDRVYDGVDLLPFLTGLDAGDPHEQLFWRADHIWAIRDGDFKLILSARDGWAELYNIRTDMSESINLKDDMPDLYQALYSKHMEWQEAMPEKPLWPRIMDHHFMLDSIEYLFPA